MKILITGNMGYVGPSIVRTLRAANPESTLVGLDTGYFANCLSNSAILPECRVDLQYFLDVRNLSASVLNGVDAVVYLAAISNDPMGNIFEAPTFDINHRAAIELAQMARERGVGKFVYASSCSMYGSAEDVPRAETSPLNPLTAYARSKVLSEQDLQRLATPRFLVTCLRFSTACGMSDRLRLDLVLNDFVASAIASKRISILSDGTPWRPLIDVKDMARAVEWALTRQSADGGDFLAINIGSDEWNYQVKDLAEAVARAFSDVDVSVNKCAQPDKRSYRVSFELFRKLAPDHQPKVDLASTINDLKQGLEAMGFSDPDFRNSRFVRLNVLNHLRENNLLTAGLEWTHNA